MVSQGEIKVEEEEDMSFFGNVFKSSILQDVNCL